MIAIFILSFHLIRLIQCACKGGTSVGSFIFLQPNRSTTAVVGSSLKLVWSLTPMVKQVPSSIDIWMANVSPDGQGYIFNIPVLKGVSGNSNSTDWIVSANNDGLYMMRVGISQRDPLLNTSACLQNGEAYGASSSTFKIVNAVAFPRPGPDLYGPATNSASAIFISNLNFSYFLFLIVLISSDL